MAADVDLLCVFSVVHLCVRSAYMHLEQITQGSGYHPEICTTMYSEQLYYRDSFLASATRAFDLTNQFLTFPIILH